MTAPNAIPIDPTPDELAIRLGPVIRTIANAAASDDEPPTTFPEN